MASNTTLFNQQLGSSSKTSTNPFARALQTTETEKFPQNAPQTAPDNQLLSQALSRTGGHFPMENAWNPDVMDQQNHEASVFDQQQQLLEQERRKAAKRKLHEQINPIEMNEVFSAKKIHVKREIDGLREELKLLVQDVKKFEKEVQLTLMTEVVNPGQDGTYYRTFFQQLRAFIMLLRQKIRSGSTWATQINGKKAKRKKSGPGLNVGGANHEKTSTVQDMMHHEKSNAYSGG